MKSNTKGGAKDKQKIGRNHQIPYRKQKRQEQTKLMKETVQDLKTEIGAIKKTQTEEILEMENLGK